MQLKNSSTFFSQKLKPLETSANLLMIASVFDSVASLKGKPDLSDDVRMHVSESVVRNTDIKKLPVSLIHSWQNLSEIYASLKNGKTFLMPKLYKSCRKHIIFINGIRTYIGIYRENACEAYRKMWSQLSVTSRTINHSLWMSLNDCNKLSPVFVKSFIMCFLQTDFINLF